MAKLAPDRVLFKPEAQPIGPNVSALLEATEWRARIFKGTSGLALMDSYPRRIVETMPGADVPWAIVAIWRAMEAGDTKKAGNIHARLAALINLMHNLDAYLPIEKLLLVEQGIFENELVRGPVGYQTDAPPREEILCLFHALRVECGK